MERTYVFNFIFKILTTIGIIGFIVVAGLSDYGNISTAEVFSYGIITFLLASIGIWGVSNCSRIIEAERKRRKKEIAKLRKLENYRNVA